MKKFYPILLHAGFWIVFIIPSVLFLFYDQNIPPHRIWYTILSTVFTILNFYLFYSFILPYCYRNKEFLILIIVTVVFILIYPLIQQQVFYFISDLFEWRSKRFKNSGWFYTGSYTSAIVFTGLAYFARFTAGWITDQQIKAELISQNRSSEMALLKSQLSPHFLFNTLNNIYSLVISKSDEAPVAMTKLSEVMRYMLYEANTDKVQLVKEIDYLKSYIDILQLRITQNNFIDFNVSGDVDNKLIAPMLLIPFVENAFKHCNKRSEAPGIIISLEVDDNKLEFKVKNSLKISKEVNDDNNGGIGTHNVKRRLELLYPEKHKLTLNKAESYFYSELIIQLK